MREVVSASAFVLLLAASPAALAADPPDATDLQVCALLANIAPRELGELEGLAGFVDIDGDGVVEGLSSLDGYRAYIGPYDGTPPFHPPVFESSSDYDQGDLKWLIFAGRAYLLDAHEDGPDYLQQVSRIGPQFDRRPLCQFAPRPTVELHADTQADEALCAVIAAAKVAHVQVQSTNPQTVSKPTLTGA
jgi:hypothetical protein